MAKTTKPLKTISFSGYDKIYYLDVHHDSKGKFYSVLSEVPLGEHGDQRRTQRIFIHKEGLQRLRDATSEILNYIETLESNSDGKDIEG